MTLSDWLRLQRLYNLVQPDRLVVGLKHDEGYQPIAVFEERIKATDDEAGLRVQVATVYRNDQSKPTTHPDNEREYHFASLICEAVNAIKPIMEQRIKEGKL
ncbi:MAG: hypothetical protein ACT4PE_05620 [Candidatus Eiseniibacteriota bacterium]